MPSLRELQQAFAEPCWRPLARRPGSRSRGWPTVAMPRRRCALPPSHERSRGRRRGNAEVPAGNAEVAAVPLAADRIGIYRNAVFANYRNALRASFRCPAAGRRAVPPCRGRRLRARASVGKRRPQRLWRPVRGFSGGYPALPPLPYLADVARLEWAVDEAQRAADVLPAQTRCWRRWRPPRRSGCPRCACGSIRRAGWSRRNFRFCTSGRRSDAGRG